MRVFILKVSGTEVFPGKYHYLKLVRLEWTPFPHLHRITEWQDVWDLEGTSGGHPVQTPCSGRAT